MLHFFFTLYIEANDIMDRQKTIQPEGGIRYFASIRIIEFSAGLVSPANPILCKA